MVLDRVPVAGEEAIEGHRRGAPEVGEVLHPGPRPRAGRLEHRHDLGVGRDVGEQVVPDEGRRAALVDQQRVGRAVPRASEDPEVPLTGAHEVAILEAQIGVVGRRGVADEIPESLVVADHRLGNAVVTHELNREGAVRRRALDVALTVVSRAVERRHLRPRPGDDRGDQSRVVEVVVGGDHELDVLDPQPFPAQAGLERAERLVAARAGVDQRERRATEQPDVDGLDVRQGSLDLNGVVHRLVRVSVGAIGERRGAHN